MTFYDPRFPNRPDHPDFWRLSRAVIANDTAVESAPDPGEAFRALVAKHVDLRSLSYMAAQRVDRFIGRMTQDGPDGPRISGDEVALAAWLDGFMAACSADDIATVFDGQRRGES
jgi:hypothetical protein